MNYGEGSSTWVSQITVRVHVRAPIISGGRTKYFITSTLWYA